MSYCNVFNFTSRGMTYALMAVLMLLSRQALAHPHSFIDMQTTVEGQDGYITGLRMNWTMDAITSADLLYDAGNATKDSVVWKKLAAQVMANVLGQHYFTDVYRNGKRVKYVAVPTEYRLSRKGNQAVLEFVLPLAHPQPLAGKPLQISTYDPTYFVDMSYKDGKAITVSPLLASHCKTTLWTPKPNLSLQAYALSLDKRSKPVADVSLGKQFAQQVTLQCQ
ncbi:DUF1007 domain-containing protein [Prodigiosinella confusarubida]|uniref:DUF1007 domain-containing protein n=1 Tax=Serratia sp. (strain ATCC 39006) TaxID=104623 RepID=A0A2I5T5S5_SERS3|nr:DUF1007 domain-containing protein [Serratia sp. ATCC 39006]AUH04249.1 DUF1007 domain-containing protein [Serratia sp. ATCC 39006]